MTHTVPGGNRPTSRRDARERGAADLAAALDAALASADTYGATGPVTVCETHASRVYLVGDRAYKVKKPVAFGFLDYRSLERRRAACHEELSVNRELAPDIYLAVVALVEQGQRIRLAPENAPAALEYAIEMRRFDEDQTLSGAISTHNVGRADIEAVARRLVRFHDHSPVVTGGGPEELLERWRTNVAELVTLARPAGVDVSPLLGFGEAFLTAHADEIRQRVREGRVRDCHGDLRCEHVLLGEEVRIVDRIEFDPGLRQIDTACDLAFLAMDLEAHRRPRLAADLVSAYQHAGGNPASEVLRAFYGAHWALVRAKVELIRAAGTSANGARSPRRPARLLRLAERLCWRARKPLAITVCGLPASGKSTLAGALARRSGYALLSSDVLRKQRAGLAPTEVAGVELYTQAETLKTYAELARAAGERLDRSGGVIVDATFRTRQQRALLLHRLDPRTRSVFVQCRILPETAITRAEARMQRKRHVSDATPDVVRAASGSFEPLDELDPRLVLPLDAELPLEKQLERVTAAVDAQLAGAT